MVARDDVRMMVSFGFERLKLMGYEWSADGRMEVGMVYQQKEAAVAVQAAAAAGVAGVAGAAGAVGAAGAAGAAGVGGGGGVAEGDAVAFVAVVVAAVAAAVAAVAAVVEHFSSLLQHAWQVQHCDFYQYAHVVPL